MQTLGGVIFNIGEEVALEQLGQGGGGTLDGGIGLLHSSHRIISLDARRDDVSCHHPLEVHDVVRRRHPEGLLDTEAEGILEAFGHPAAQGPQTAGH